MRVVSVAGLAIVALCVGCSTAPDAQPVPDSDGESNYFLNTLRGYSFSHPAHYDVGVYDEDGIALFVGSLLNVEAPRLDVVVEPARGSDAATIADQTAAGFPDLELARSSLTLGGEQAVVLDGVPGQDLSRIVIAVHNERLHKLTFRPVDPDNVALMAELEALYEEVTDSYTFDPAP